ncbi:MAG: MarR family winged helix-turn-helix transcriptional regulator [Rhizobiaceae bacterium]
MGYTDLKRPNVPRDLFLGNVLGAFSRALCDKMDSAVCSATGRNTTACYAIVQIGSEPGSSIEILRRMLGLEHSSVVRLLDRLEKENLVNRVRGTELDQRKVCVFLTDEGEREFTKILDARREVLDRVMIRVNDVEKSFLLSLIHKVMPQVVDCGDDQHIVCRLCDLEKCPQEKCPVNLAYPENMDEVSAPFTRRGGF